MNPTKSIVSSASVFRVHDSLREHDYEVEAKSPSEALQAVQNDQWQEALDAAGVTPVEQLKIIAAPS